MSQRMLKVGELAARTGLTVRTLHHYDEIGLLEPARRTPSGHRLYGDAEVRRLHAIASLSRLGLSLDEIRECLDSPDDPLADTIELQVERLRSEIEKRRHLLERLERLLSRLRSPGGVPADELIPTIEATMTIDDYYTPEQQAYLAKRRDEVGEDRIQEIQTAWKGLIADIRAKMDAGADPEDPEVGALAERWRRLQRETIEGFTGGDPGIAASLRRMYREEPEAAERFGMDPDLVDFIGRAMSTPDAST